MDKPAFMAFLGSRLAFDLNFVMPLTKIALELHVDKEIC
jgi:hypothetical protein